MSASNTCPDCAQSGELRDHVLRRLVDLPVVGFPTRLHVRVPRFTCTNAFCGRKIFQATLSCADDGATFTHRVTRWILQRLAVDRMSVSATAKALGVDEHVWKHTRKPGQPSSLVTILVDLTPLVDGRGPARLLDMRPGRSAQVLRTWLQERDPIFREKVQAVTMDGFTNYASAVDQMLPDATKVMDPFHLAHLAADKPTHCRQRLQRETSGRRGRKDDPLYKHRRTLLTKTNYLTERQKQRLDQLWATDDEYVALEVTWMFYQDIIAAYGIRRRRRARSS